MSAAALLGLFQMKYPLGMYEADMHVRHHKIPYFTKDMIIIGNLRFVCVQLFFQIIKSVFLFEQVYNRFPGIVRFKIRRGQFYRDCEKHCTSIYNDHIKSFVG